MFIIQRGENYYHAADRKDLPDLVHDIAATDTKSLEQVISECQYMEIDTNKTKTGSITPDEPLCSLLRVKVGLAPQAK